MGWLPSAAKIYRALLLAYPAEFRFEYGQEMERFFKSRLRAEHPIRVWLETLADLVISAVGEHLHLLREDVRYCARSLTRSPVLALTAILTIALGMGASTTVFSIVNALLTRSMPYADAERLVNLWTPNPRLRNLLSEIPPSNADFAEWRRRSHSFSDMTQWNFTDLGLVTENETSPIRVASVDGNFFRMLGVAPERGRAIDSADDRPGHEHVAVISDRLWRTFLGADASALGRSLQLGRDKYTVIGIAPASFLYPNATDLAHDMGGPPHTDVWIPSGLTPAARTERVNRNRPAIGRLRPGVAARQAEAELARIEADLAPQYPAAVRGWTAAVRSFADTSTGPVRSMVLLLSGAVLLVLLIACANVANLLMARAAARAPELGVRGALGAGRARLARLILTEGLLISAAGGVAGIALAFAGVALVASFGAGRIPGVENASPDLRVFLFAFALSTFAGVFIGGGPGLTASRVDVMAFLKRGGRTITGGSDRLRRLLIVVEVALSVILLSGAGLLLRSWVKLAGVDKGFDQSPVVASISLDRRFYGAPEAQWNFDDRLVAETGRQPGIELAAAINRLPLNPNDPNCAFALRDRAETQSQAMDCRTATPGYFQLAGIRLLRGRIFSETDDTKHPAVAIVNRAFAVLWFGSENAVGREIQLGGPRARWSAIVGVVSDTRRSKLEEQPVPSAYLPLRQGPAGSVDLLVQTRLSTTETAAIIRRVLRRIDPAVPGGEIRTIGEIVAAANAPRRFETSILTGFAAFAVLLASLALYGMTSYSVGRRTAEIGIRRALGASRWRVMGMVLAQHLGLVLAGMVLGLAATPLLTQFIKASLFGVTGYDPATYLLVAGFLLAVAFVACLLPVWKAVRIDPMAALRYE